MNENMTGVSKTILPFIVSGRMSRFLGVPVGRSLESGKRTCGELAAVTSFSAKSKTACFVTVNKPKIFAETENSACVAEYFACLVGRMVFF